MTITTTKTICDVTGKETPTLPLVLPNHNCDTGLLAFDISHDGAILMLRKMAANSSYCLSVLRESSELTRKETHSPEPTHHPGPIEWRFSHKDYEDHIDKIRKQAARECIEIMQSEVNRIIYQGPYFEPERNITERIIKAFGL